MKKFLLIAVPLTIAAGAAIALTHPKECKKYVKAIKYMGTDSLEKAREAAYNCAEKLFICPKKYK